MTRHPNHMVHGDIVSKSSTLTVTIHEVVIRVSIQAFDRKDGLRKRSCSFWIKSSAKRAFGGCLGSKRR